MIAALSRLNPFRVPTFSEKIANEIETAEWELQAAQQTIENHRYLEHMAQAKIAALHEWNARRKS